MKWHAQMLTDVTDWGNVGFANGPPTPLHVSHINCSTWALSRRQSFPSFSNLLFIFSVSSSFPSFSKELWSIQAPVDPSINVFLCSQAAFSPPLNQQANFPVCCLGILFTFSYRFLLVSFFSPRHQKSWVRGVSLVHVHTNSTSFILPLSDTRSNQQCRPRQFAQELVMALSMLCLFPLELPVCIQESLNPTPPLWKWTQSSLQGHCAMHILYLVYLLGLRFLTWT